MTIKSTAIALTAFMSLGYGVFSAAQIQRGEPPPEATAPAAQSEFFYLPESLRPNPNRTPGAVQPIERFPVAPGLEAPLLLERREVYASGARIVVIDEAGEREIPRSLREYYVGVVPDKPHIRVALSVDSTTGTARGMTISPSGIYQIVEPEGADPLLHQLRLQKNETLQGEPLSFDCSAGELPVPNTVAEWMHSPAISQRQTAAPTHSAVIAVDTDTEFNLEKFNNNQTAAVDWIADLFVEMNLFYERDLGLRLLQGDTFIRTASDSYSVTGLSAQLTEFGNYWSTNYSNVQRVMAMHLSGKSSSAYSAAGIAWVDSYCQKQSYGGSYSVNRVFTFDGAVAADDAALVGHELGHNFGSVHTHCYSPPIDQCYNQESGCYSGPASCPASGHGTLMSYCHLLGNCTASEEFHSRTVDLITNRFLANTPGCVEELNAVSSIFLDGFEAMLPQNLEFPVLLSHSRLR